MVNSTIKNLRRIAFYIRVSTDAQDKAETSSNQLRDLYKVYNKTDVVGVYEDTGSGADPERSDLKRLRADAKKGLFDVIAVWDTSRLARDVILALTMRAEFKALGIKIEVMGKEQDDADDAKIYTMIESWMDEREREKIKRRFISGRDRRLSEGKLIGCYPPYGYKHIRRNRETGADAYFEVNEQEAINVRKIFDLYLKYESIIMVAYQLRREGIKGRGKGRPEPGFMQTSTVSKILKSENYIGNHYFGKSSPSIAKFHIHKSWKHRYTGRKTNPKSEWKSVKVPTIIDREIFDKAQAIREKRAKHRIEMSKYEFLCTGIIRCIHCGRSYGGRSQNDYLLYRCPQCYTSNLNQPPCKSRTIGGAKLDRIIWAYVGEMINDRDKIRQAIIDSKEKRRKGKSSIKKSMDALSLEKNTLKKKRKNLFDLYSEGGFSDQAKEDLKTKLAEMDEAEKHIDKQITEIKSELEEIKNAESMEVEIEEIRKMYQKKIKNPSFELKKYIVRKWIEEININDDGSIKIKVRIPKGVIPEKEEKELVFSENQILRPGLRFEELVHP